MILCSQDIVYATSPIGLSKELLVISLVDNYTNKSIQQA